MLYYPRYIEHIGFADPVIGYPRLDLIRARGNGDT